MKCAPIHRDRMVERSAIVGSKLLRLLKDRLTHIYRHRFHYIV